METCDSAFRVMCMGLYLQ